MAYINAVTNMMNRAGIECHTPVATATTTGGICANMSQGVDNIAKIGMLTDQIQQQQQGMSSGPSSGGGNTFLRSALTTGALAIGMVVAPQVTAVVAAVASVGEAAHFGLKGNAGQGELTAAGFDAAQAFEKGEYIAACDGQSTNIMTGKTSSGPAAIGQKAAPAKGMHNLQEIVADEMSGADLEEVQGMLKRKAKENMAVVDAGLYNLEKRGVLNSSDPNAAALRENMDDVGKQIAALNPPKPLKALNVGMGAPSMGMM